LLTPDIAPDLTPALSLLAFSDLDSSSDVDRSWIIKGLLSTVSFLSTLCLPSGT